MPANRRHWLNAGSMLVHHLRCWSNIDLTLGQCDPTLGQCLLFSGPRYHWTIAQGPVPLKSSIWIYLNPLNPRDALKHHFTSLKTDLILLQQRVLERKFPWNSFTNTWQFSLIFHPHQIIFIYYNSRLVVDEDDNGKFRLERVNPLGANHEQNRVKFVFLADEISLLLGVKWVFKHQ